MTGPLVEDLLATILPPPCLHFRRPCAHYSTRTLFTCIMCHCNEHKIPAVS